MTLIIRDPSAQERLIAERKRLGLDRYDEVWEGVYVMSPSPNNDHQEMVGAWAELYRQILYPEKKGRVFVCPNVSDRVAEWTSNFRCPDLAVFLKGSPAQDHNTFWCGGPDWAVEIISDGDRARDKFDFYAGVGTRELLIVERDPWALELHVLKRGKLKLAGACSLEQPAILTSTVLPVTFTLVAGEPRPLLEVMTPVGESPRRF